jgi:hypothetical protein
MDVKFHTKSDVSGVGMRRQESENLSVSKRKSIETWRELYLSALFEADPKKLMERIADAEIALVVRARELFESSGDSIEEKSALDDAMYALHALRGTVESRTRGPAEWTQGNQRAA